MAFEYDKKLPALPGEYYTPLPVEADESLSYGYYPADNPDTPYVPTDPATAWWDTLPEWEVGMTSGSTEVSGWSEIPNTVWNPVTNDWQQVDFDSMPRLWEQSQDADPTGISQFASDYDAFYSSQSKVSWFDEIEKRRAGANGSRYKKYNTYTGADMVPTITMPNGGTHVVGEISTMSISVHSETFPVRMLGKRGVQGFTRGPRTIAGSLIFTQFDLYPFYNVVSSAYNKGDVPITTSESTFPLSDSLPPFDITISFMNEYGNYAPKYGNAGTSMGQNSYKPRGSVLRLYGVVLVDDGLTLSVDDLVPENVYSYMAAGIAPMHYPSGWTAT